MNNYKTVTLARVSLAKCAPMKFQSMIICDFYKEYSLRNYFNRRSIPLIISAGMPRFPPSKDRTRHTTARGGNLILNACATSLCDANVYFRAVKLPASNDNRVAHLLLKQYNAAVLRKISDVTAASWYRGNLHSS
jgi:hypothetical protein